MWQVFQLCAYLNSCHLTFFNSQHVCTKQFHYAVTHQHQYRLIETLKAQSFHLTFNDFLFRISFCKQNNTKLRVRFV